jgi:hypothetical protein
VIGALKRGLAPLEMRFLLSSPSLGFPQASHDQGPGDVGEYQGGKHQHQHRAHEHVREAFPEKGWLQPRVGTGEIPGEQKPRSSR